MKILVSILCLFLLTISAPAQKITASITVTNKTTNGMTFTLNGDTRTFTNLALNPATTVLTNADVTGCGSKTNLLQQIYTQPFSQVAATDTGSNTFTLTGNCGLPMAVTVSAGWASFSYSTQACASVFVLQGPVPNLPTARARTNAANAIVGAANAPENSTTISQITPAAAELLGTTNTQTIDGIKYFTNALGEWFGIVTNAPAISGVVIWFQGGYFTNSTLDNPTSTNLVNFGNAISSPGIGSQSEQFGVGAVASGLGSVAAGPGAFASGDFSSAFGDAASATNTASFAAGQNARAYGFASVAIGVNSAATNTLSTAVGEASAASGNGSSAFGALAKATNDNSTAIGKSAQTTTANQVMLGAPGISTVVQNNLTVQTNLVVGGGASILGLQTNGAYTGTNNFVQGADIAFARFPVTSLANGGNAAVPVGTNVYIAVSGPTGAFSINGIAGGRDGKLQIIENSTGQTMTIANASGTDPTAANRILTGTGADIAVTSNPGMVTLIYSASASRWILVSHN